MGKLKQPLTILESGIASFGTNSTYLFNEYVRKYGGRFWSVDINPALVNQHRGNMCPATQLVAQDSVQFFKNWVQENPGLAANVIYLDSYDLDFHNPRPSGQHGFNEYAALKPAIHEDTLLLIDDTPVNPYWLDTRGQLYKDMLPFYAKHKMMPGKGMYVVPYVKPTEADMLLHNYQVLYKFKQTPA